MKTSLLLLLSITFSMASVPVNASPKIETCINQQMAKKPEFSFDEVSVVSSVEYSGYQYHWLNLNSKTSWLSSNVEAIIKVNQRGHCELTFFNPTGALPTLEAYYQHIGQGLTDKFNASIN